MKNHFYMTSKKENIMSIQESESFSLNRVVNISRTLQQDNVFKNVRPS